MIFIDIAKSPQTGSITDNVCGKLNYEMNVIKPTVQNWTLKVEFSSIIQACSRGS